MLRTAHLNQNVKGEIMSSIKKFRAWGKNIKEYLSQDGIEPYCFTLKDISKGCIYDLDLFVMEQYTGLKDKNGKKIYENCELDGRYRVEYIAPKFVCKDIINGDIIELYDNKFTITKEHCEISQNSERGIN